MKTTINQVAAAAGVAPSTVSKALSGRGRMKPETRSQIVAAARALGYLTPSQRDPAPGTVGLLTVDGYNRFTPSLIGGIEDALSSQQCAVMLCDARRDSVRQRHYLDVLVSRNVDGLIVVGRHTNPRPVVLAHPPFPVVYGYYVPTDPEAMCVSSDDEHGGYLAGRQLLRDGRRRLAIISGPEDFVATEQRLSGFARALTEAGIDPQVLRVPGGWSEEHGHLAAAQLLADDPSIDGIFAMSDQIARGAADSLHDLGIGVPGDVALVGFDNWELLAAATRPPLTTIDMNLYWIGRRAGEAVLDALGNTQVPGGRQLIHCSTVVRASCPAPAGADAIGVAPAPVLSESIDSPLR